MRSKIIESAIDGLWLKVLVAVLDQDELTKPSALPYNREHMPGRPILQLERKTTRHHVWILDLSTGEGATFLMDEPPEFALQKTFANL